jgi:hypothetical protein
MIRKADDNTADWVPYMGTIGSYVDERFNSTNTKIKVATDDIINIKSELIGLKAEDTNIQVNLNKVSAQVEGNTKDLNDAMTDINKRLAQCSTFKGEFNFDYITPDGEKTYEIGDTVTYNGDIYTFNASPAYSQPIEFFDWTKWNIATGSEEGNANVSATTDNAILKWDSNTNKIVESKVVATDNGSVILNDGTASGSHSIVGGTNDNSVISNILGTLGSMAVSVDKPTSSANTTISIGSGTKALSTGSNAIGVLNTVGVKGYYYTNINFNAKTITLSTSRSSSSGSNLATKFKDGDAISFVNDSKFPFCCKVVGSKTSGNVITVDSLPEEAQKEMFKHYNIPPVLEKSFAAAYRGNAIFTRDILKVAILDPNMNEKGFLYITNVLMGETVVSLVLKKEGEFEFEETDIEIASNIGSILFHPEFNDDYERALTNYIFNNENNIEES